MASLHRKQWKKEKKRRKQQEKERAGLATKRRRLDSRTRGLLWLAYGQRCVYCGEVVDRYDFRLDHIVPLEKGGVDSLTNLTVACVRCDLVKGIKLLLSAHAVLLIKKACAIAVQVLNQQSVPAPLVEELCALAYKPDPALDPVGGGRVMPQTHFVSPRLWEMEEMAGYLRGKRYNYLGD